MNYLELRSLLRAAWSDSSKWPRVYADAESRLRQELEREPENIDALTCLGAVMSDQGKYVEAQSLLKRAVDLGSEDRNTFFNLFVAALNTETAESARGWLDASKTLKPSENTWEAYFDPQAQ